MRASLKGLIATVACGTLAAAAAAAFEAGQFAVVPGGGTGLDLPQARAQVGGALLSADIVYALRTGHRPLRLDLYRAPGDTPQPVVVFVHGGSWTVGHKRATANYGDFPAVLAAIAEDGIAVAAVEYRLSGEAPFPAAVLDVKAAVRHLRAHAADLGIDPDRIAIWGASAGANLAAMAAFACDDPQFPADLPDDAPDRGAPPVSDCVRAFVGWYGPYDLAPMLTPILPLLGMPADAVPPGLVEAAGSLRYLRCTPEGCPAEVVRQASPVFHVDRGDPPTLLLYGAEDTLVAASQSEALAQALAGADVPVEHVTFGGVGHGWDAPDDLAASTRASHLALEQTVDFLQRALASGSGP